MNYTQGLGGTCRAKASTRHHSQICSWKQHHGKYQASATVPRHLRNVYRFQSINCSDYNYCSYISVLSRNRYISRRFDQQLQLFCFN